jgi:hypothetical protein
MPKARDKNLGRKVFFLHPHSVIRDRLLWELMNDEYEVYLFWDHERVRKLLKVFSDSILFINLDDGLKEPEWEDYVRAIMSDKDTREVRIGILSFYEDKALAEKYLMDIMVPCGFIKLKIGIEESTKIILKTLEANEAKGRRRFVRAVCKSCYATFNIKISNSLLTGEILDISSAGMACTFDGGFSLEPNTRLDDIQLRLKGFICRVSGRVAGITQGDNRRTIIMFNDGMDYQTLQKIRKFIFSTLQNELNEIEV